MLTMFSYHKYIGDRTHLIELWEITQSCCNGWEDSWIYTKRESSIRYQNIQKQSKDTV